MSDETSNPFKQSMVRLQLPPGMGSSVAARGFTVEADKEGCVEVPGDLANEFLAHGLKPVEPKAKK